MNQCLIEYCRNKYKNATGNMFPCSNQVVGCHIICQKIDDKIKRFLTQKNAKFLSYSKFVEFDDTIWRIIEISSGARGYRHYKIYIDTRIGNEDMEQIVMPCLGSYCEEVNFF